MCSCIRGEQLRSLLGDKEEGWLSHKVIGDITVRSFRRTRETHDIRLIKLHHVRHTVASLLKALGVPARDAQIILGHSRLAVTLEIYTHTDDEAQLDALTRLHDLFDQDDEDEAEG